MKSISLKRSFERRITMKVLIENCFNWIGFHLTNYLLEKGMRIEGLDQINTEKKEHLSMYVGRNDRFALLERRNNEGDDYDLTIKITEKIKNDRHNTFVSISRRKNSMQTKRFVIDVPEMIGEWMPLDMFNVKETSIKSKQFLNNVIHIEDFLAVVYQWIKMDSLMPETIKLISSKDKIQRSMKLENYVYLRDNRSKEKDMDKILSHYKRFKYFYQN